LESANISEKCNVIRRTKDITTALLILALVGGIKSELVQDDHDDTGRPKKVAGGSGKRK
jgi:hypothetical protein